MDTCVLIILINLTLIFILNIKFINQETYMIIYVILLEFILQAVLLKVLQNIIYIILQLFLKLKEI